MHSADKAVLRLAIGLGLAVLIAYGLALPGPFVVCALAAVVLCTPSPPMPLVKGLVVSAVVATLLVAGVLMVPLLRHYPATGVVLIGAALYAAFYAGVLKPSPVTTIQVIALTIIPVAGLVEQALATVLAQAIGLGFAIGFLVNAISHALFPDTPAPARPTAAPAGVSPDAASAHALQATSIVMPIVLMALTNPSFYISAVMKAVVLAEQADATNAKSAGRELVGSTAVGALMAVGVWMGLTMLPNLWMMTLWLVAAALWAGARHFRVKATSFPPSFWVNALVTMFVLLGPAIEDAQIGNDPYRASAIRLGLFICIALYGWAMVWVFERWRASRSASPEVQPRRR